MGATWEALRAIPPHHYLLAAASTLVAYAALAWYDQIALLHLGVRHISWLFVSLCSFTTYALSHNIGASVFSGAMVRYRAYSTKGMTAAQVAILVALCSFTFFLGTILLGGFVLTFQPQQLSRLDGLLPAALTQESAARTIGGAALAFALLYAVGSLLQLRPLKIGPFRIDYPRPSVMARQFVAAPMELIGAAGIIYFALPEAGNPGFLTVLAVFLASFSAGLVSHAPGGLGVFELVFITAHAVDRQAPDPRRADRVPPVLSPHSAPVRAARRRRLRTPAAGGDASRPQAPAARLRGVPAHGLVAKVWQLFADHAWTGLAARNLRATRTACTGSYRVPSPRLPSLCLPSLRRAAAAPRSRSLAACGRRGPLELPPGVAPPRAPQAIDPTDETAARRSLARDTSGANSLNAEQVLAPPSPIIVPQTPFFLDPLL